MSLVEVVREKQEALQAQDLAHPVARSVAHTRRANDIPNAQLQAEVAEAMERASRGIHKASSLAEQIGDTEFVSVLDRLRIKSMTAIPRLEALKALVAEFEREATRFAA